MRIISGKLKGRPLTAPKGQNTRPTSDRARESIFNVLEHAAWAPPLNEARVIDLFAGSGGLGLEAISRGAAFALFVETDNAARGAIRQNIEDFQLFGCTRIHRRSATALGPRPSNLGAPFNLAFLDPPYHKGLVVPALGELINGAWLTEDAAIMVESAAGETLYFDNFQIANERIKGAAKVTFLTRT